MVIVHLSDTQRRIISPEKNETLEDLFKRFCSEFGYPRAQYEFRSYPRDEYVPLDMLINANRVKEVSFVEKFDSRRGSCDSCYTTIHEAATPAYSAPYRKKISAPTPPNLPSTSEVELSKSRTKKRSAPRPPPVVEVVPTDSRRSTLRPELSTPDIDIPPPPTSLPGPEGHVDPVAYLPYRSVECETDTPPRRPSNITQQAQLYTEKSDDTDNDSATSPINFPMSVPCASQETLESLEEHFSGSNQMRSRDGSTSSSSSVNDVYENEKWVRVTFDDSDDGHDERERETEREQEKEREREREKEREREREKEQEKEREREREKERQKERERELEKEREKEQEKEREREKERQREKEREREREKEREKELVEQPLTNYNERYSQPSHDVVANEIGVTDISVRNWPQDESGKALSTRSDGSTSAPQHRPMRRTSEQLVPQAVMSESRPMTTSDVRETYKQSRSKAQTVDICSNIDLLKEDEDASESVTNYWDVTKQSKTMQELSRTMHTTIDSCETSDGLAGTRDKVADCETIGETHSSVEQPTQQVQRMQEPAPRAVRVIVQETAAVDPSGRPMFRPRQGKSLFFTTEPKQP